MSKLQFILFLFTIIGSIFVSCNSETNEKIQIGLETNIIATDRDILSGNSVDSTVFKEYLQIDKLQHYPGKAFVLFDTLYTSTVDNLNPSNVLDYMKQGEVSFINMNADHKRSIYKLILKKRDRFIYRVIVPEELKQQSILIDFVSSDSSLVASYFKEERISKLIK